MLYQGVLEAAAHQLLERTGDYHGQQTVAYILVESLKGCRPLDEREIHP